MVANGQRYRQARDLEEKTTRRRIRRWGRIPEGVGECPRLSGVRGVGQVLQDDFEFVLLLITAYIGGRTKYIF